MRKTIALLFFALTLSMTSIPAQANTITVLSQTYSISGGVCTSPLPPAIPNCIGNSQSSSTAPVSYQNNAGPIALDLLANGGTNLSGGFLETHGLVFGGNGSADTTATMDFRAIEGAPIVISASASGLGFFLTTTTFTDVTTNVVLFSFSSTFNNSRSFTALLNNTDTYRLTSRTQISGPDFGQSQVNFSVPEAPAFWLLGIAVGVLGLGRQRMRTSLK